MSEPQDTIALLSESGRKRIADRLRFTADRLQQGLITPDQFSVEPEWIDQPPLSTGLRSNKPTGRMFLTFNYWVQSSSETL